MSPPATGRSVSAETPVAAATAASRLTRRGAQLGDQPAAGRLDDVEHVLEPALAAVVRVGHVEVGALRRSPGRTRAAAAPSRAPRRPAPASRRSRQVLGGPSRREVEVVEVGRPHLARRAVERDPAPVRGGRGALVGRLADVPAAGAGAVDLDLVVEPGLAQRCRITPSAVGERQMLPMHTKRIRIASRGWQARFHPWSAGRMLLNEPVHAPTHPDQASDRGPRRDRRRRPPAAADRDPAAGLRRQAHDRDRRRAQGRRGPAGRDGADPAAARGPRGRRAAATASDRHAGPARPADRGGGADPGAVQGARGHRAARRGHAVRPPFGRRARAADQDDGHPPWRAGQAARGHPGRHRADRRPRGQIPGVGRWASRSTIMACPIPPATHIVSRP